MANVSIPRVPKERVERVRGRLKRARDARGYGYRTAARLITAERQRLEAERAKATGTPKRLNTTVGHVDVARYEGTGRKTAAPIDYVEAAAAAYGVNPDWMKGEVDVPMLIGGPEYREIAEAQGEEAALDAAIADQWGPNPKIDPLEEEMAEIRGRVRAILFQAMGGVPDAERSLESRTLDELEVLYWEAFGGRVQTMRDAIDAAKQLGLVLVTPRRLPTLGFLPVWEVGESAYREFWQLQIAAIRRMARPLIPCEMSLVREDWEEHTDVRIARRKLGLNNPPVSWEHRREQWRKWIATHPDPASRQNGRDALSDLEEAAESDASAGLGRANAPQTHRPVEVLDARIRSKNKSAR